MSLIYEPLKKRAQIKEEAKNLLGGKWVEGSVFVFIAMILTSLGSLFTNIFMMSENAEAFAILLDFAYTCLVGEVFSVALLKYFKKIGNGEHVTFSELTKPFSYYSDVVVYSVVTILLVLVPAAAIFVISLALYNTYLSGLLITLMCLALIPLALILEAWSVYVMLDLGDATLKEVFSRSLFLAKKSWFQFIILSLSFIGWYIVGMCACGIGIYVVMPYYYTSVALFHKNLKAHYFGTEIPDEPIINDAEDFYTGEFISDSINTEDLQTDNNNEATGEDF